MSHRVDAIASHLTAGSVQVSSFDNVPLAPLDAIFALSGACNADPDPLKINLSIGAYRDNDGKPWVLPVVKKSLGVQTISGTGAVRLGADFLAKYRKAPVYISDPTWGNHGQILNDAGYDVRTYKYWDPQTRGLAFDKMMQCFREAPNGSIIVLHACAHNPTGVDPTQEQWKEIAKVIREKSHFPFFDCAYQGFASGSLDKDAWAVRYFVEQGFELLVAQSFSKNFGLYGERTGCLTVVTSSETQAVNVRSQLCRLIRASFSNPPSFGARICNLVLNDPALYAEWEDNLRTMANRIIKMRDAVYSHLVTLKTPGTWTHITSQIGMFSFTGLSLAQVTLIKSKFHVYMTDNGRVSMAGLNEGNAKRFAEAIDFVVRNA
ncbi:Aspartate aminotransferase, cytoplasmic [Blyttiomyces sp. JEL0837]|nr:Aspartate aminotransferase, cytoplasmic [Blyttiomyces sp. JEL0837]